MPRYFEGPALRESYHRRSFHCKPSELRQPDDNPKPLNVEAPAQRSSVNRPTLWRTKWRAHSETRFQTCGSTPATTRQSHLKVQSRLRAVQSLPECPRRKGDLGRPLLLEIAENRNLVEARA